VRACGSSELQLQDLAESVDLSVAIHVLHEMPDPASAIRQMAASLRPGGQLMILEPKGHCPEAVFQAELHWAEQAGLTRMPDPWNLGARHQGALFRKM
jgi:SAM-dependent methyltransferase